ncbi:CsiV family protein [Pleionea sediminis]|uniref:CsiV family protein n=1 Tax=Pleionea sediminis TaxID=2569479 RepID=UPI00118530C1|nr:CsiV family protein [Pleionea sediminis]
MVTSILKKCVFAGVVINCLIASAPLMAQSSDDEPRWFDVEVIIFKNLRGNIEEELWPDKLAIEYPESIYDIITHKLYPNSAQLPQSSGSHSQDNPQSSTQLPANSTPVAGEQTDSFILLGDEELQLKNIEGSLSRSSQYRPLVHFAWRQPVHKKSEAPWVRIVGGKNYDDTFDHEGNLKAEGTQLNRYQFDANSPNNTSMNSQEDNMATINKHPAVPEIDGALRIYLERYLHINTKLFLRIPGREEVDLNDLNSNLSSSLLQLTDDGVMSSNYESNFGWTFDSSNWFDQKQKTTTVEKLLNYDLSQSRRVRSEEVHYFDHPLYGVIIQIRPYDDEKSEQISGEQ